MSPLVAEVYGPDEAGRQQLAARILKAFEKTPDISPPLPEVSGLTQQLSRAPPSPPRRFAFWW